MYSSRIVIILLCIGIFPIFSYAEGGYIGENPGLNFYSTIDDGNYQIMTKRLKVRLVETPTIDTFGKYCLSANLLQGEPATIEFFESLANLDYSKLSEALAKRGVKNVSTDTYQNLAMCLVNSYGALIARTEREQATIENLSSLGLYMDGDTGNSDYDLLTDIQKINSVIFSQDLKYEGATNTSSKSFANLLAGKPTASLFAPPAPTTTGSVTATGTPTTGSISTPLDAGTTGNSGKSPTQSATNLSSLIGGTCGSTSVTSVTNMVDDNFTRDLEIALRGGVTGAAVGGGYTPPVGRRAPMLREDGSGDTNSSANSGPNAPKTSSSDFFDKMPCTSIFCIKVSMIAGSANALGGGKNISIEGILDKHSKILYPISESSLRCETMQNEFATPNPLTLKFKNVLSGLQVYVTSSPQRTRNDKRDETPERKDAQLEDARRCAYASVGLDTDAKRANGMIGGGFIGTAGATAETIVNRTIPLGPQETAELARYTRCLDAALAEGRKSYYDSFSTDLTEVQAFTSNILKEIEGILETGVKMNTKPLECPN